MRGIDELVERVRASVGDSIAEDVPVDDGRRDPAWPATATPPPPRETWIDLQSEVVELAAAAPTSGRRRLARALLRAVVGQSTAGPSNRLQADAFALILDAARDDLSAVIEPTATNMYGGRRYLLGHLWTVPGQDGAWWLHRLASLDEGRASSLYQAMRVGKVGRWRPEDWPGRLDAIAALPIDPRPEIVRVLGLIDPPRGATPTLVRVALVHGTDERDEVVRFVARRIRDLCREDGNAEVSLYDWERWRERPELFRWILELSGPRGRRRPLVAAAVDDHLVTAEEGRYLASPLEGPDWADGDVPWVLDDRVSIGAVPLPSGRLAGGDPWSIGRAEEAAWIVDLAVTGVDVEVILATHPLYGTECAALVISVADVPIATWTLVESSWGRQGYEVGVGVASVGAVECYESGVVFEAMGDEMFLTRPVWRLLENPGHGGIAMCSVLATRQMCRTWIGTDASGVTAQLITDLGLLDLDPTATPGTTNP